MIIDGKGTTAAALMVANTKEIVPILEAGADVNVDVNNVDISSCFKQHVSK